MIDRETDLGSPALLWVKLQDPLLPWDAVISAFNFAYLTQDLVLVLQHGVMGAAPVALLSEGRRSGIHGEMQDELLLPSRCSMFTLLYPCYLPVFVTIKSVPLTISK